MQTLDDLVTATVVGRSPVVRGPVRPHDLAGSVCGSIRAAAKHPRLMPYHRLMVTVVVVNLAVLFHHLRRGDWRIADGTALSALSALALVNVTGAVLIRQQTLLNILYGLAGRGSRSWPLWVRWSVSKVHHVGGLHAGFAIAGTAWLCAFSGVAFLTRARHPGSVTDTTLVLCLGLVVLMVLVTVCASPPVRTRAHNVFEQSHRWGGWTAVVLFWALTVHLALRGRGATTALEAIASDWHVWVLAMLTANVAWPWLRLRRVPVTVQRPSAHAAIVHLDYGVRPAYPSAVGISLSPLREWHAFATVTTPGHTGYRLLISRAGDWTGRFIDDPPSHVWVRGIPVAAPMAKVSVLYERVVYVVTGSGIGPVLGQILANRVPARLVWSTRDPRRTYGDALVDEVEIAQPDAVIWDTTKHGKPDLLDLALDTCVDFGAEAVFVVSNKSTTLGLVHDLERRGIPAFGPIWDS
ncbi:MAG TPA: hypothetical protein VNO51_08735 [Ilumatobacteraceae bacterium]|nr:hypothetical protein [Ilumatobacteraceae bacterium]